MAKKDYSVRFASAFVADKGERVPFTARFSELAKAGGTHLAEFSCEGEAYQIRDLCQVGQVWKGAFAKLRHDAPHKVTSENVEEVLPLNAGDRILQKVHFLYYTHRNIIVMQYDRMLATTNKLQIYLCGISQQYVDVHQCMNTAEVEGVLSRNLYEIEYAQCLPTSGDEQSPKWSRSEFRKMKSIKAAIAKMTFRADRGQSLGENVKQILRDLVSDPSASKIRVRVTDDTSAIDLFSAPIKDSFSVELLGNYPDPAKVYESLHEAYTRKSPLLPNGAT